MFEKVECLYPDDAVLLFKELFFQRRIHDGLVAAHIAGQPGVDGVIKIVFQHQRFGDVEVDVDVAVEGNGNGAAFGLLRLASLSSLACFRVCAAATLLWYFAALAPSCLLFSARLLAFLADSTFFNSVFCALSFACA